jgi:hypothetical protein
MVKCLFEEFQRISKPQPFLRDRNRGNLFKTLPCYQLPKLAGAIDEENSRGLGVFLHWMRVILERREVVEQQERLWSLVC